MLPAIPTPPLTTNAPDAVLVATLALDIKVGPMIVAPVPPIWIPATLAKLANKLFQYKLDVPKSVDKLAVGRIDDVLAAPKCIVVAFAPIRIVLAVSNRYAVAAVVVTPEPIRLTLPVAVILPE